MVGDRNGFNPSFFKMFASVAGAFISIARIFGVSFSADTRGKG